MITGKKPQILMNRMQRAVNRALEWGDRNGLTFNPSKTEVLLFNRKKEPELPTKLQMSGKSVDFTDQVRYLGVILDTKLSWKPHIKLKVKNAKAALAKARSSLGQLGGFQAMLSKWIYTGIVRPALTYGALVWAPGCESKWAQKELTRVNRLALMSLGSFRRSTPTAGLEVLMDVRPLPLHINYEACLGLRRTTNKSKTPQVYAKDCPYKGHRKHGWLKFDEIDYLPKPSDKKSASHSWHRDYDADTEKWGDGKPEHPTPGGVVAYTDGSGMDEKFGAGLVIYRNRADDANQLHWGAHHLTANSSVYQGEIFAIKKAAELSLIHI